MARPRRPASLFRPLLTIGVCVWLLAHPGCRSEPGLLVTRDGQPAVRALTDAERTGDLAFHEPFPDYATAPTDGRGRVFLAALGSDIANFAQEVVDQRAFWLERGVDPDAILCYYVKPTREDYLAERAQFDALADDLAGFYPAAPDLIGRHLREAAAAGPEAVYVYLTGHGSGPRSFTLRPREAASPPWTYLLGTYPPLDDHTLGTDATDRGTANLPMKLHAAQRGAELSDLFLTPAVLRDWLLAFPPSTRKVVVLQACFSGGFLERDPDYPASSSATLRDVPTLVAIAAARHDRPSFGCSPGEDRTIFGGIFLKALGHAAHGDGRIDWTALYRRVRSSVDQTEERMDVPVARRSRPVLITTPPAAGAP